MGMEKPRRSEYTPSDFVGFRESGSLELTPKFQRRTVWRQAQRSYFIDTLLRGMPVPPLYFRESQNVDFSKMVREVVDGQQRIRAVLDFVDNNYQLSRSLSGRWAGRAFDELEALDRAALKGYAFHVEVFTSISDAEVLDIFARLNTYSSPLNAQELRNGKYFGPFKRTCYALGHEYIEFWRSSKIFTEARIARMAEVELTSELVIFMLGGVQDKKKSIDQFYADFDVDFPLQDRAVDAFRATIDAVVDILDPATLARTPFRRGPLFYSLFGAAFRAIYSTGVEGKRRRLKKGEVSAMRGGIASLSDALDLAKEGGSVPARLRSFVDASQRQTDNLHPRQVRLETLSSFVDA